MFRIETFFQWYSNTNEVDDDNVWRWQSTSYTRKLSKETEAVIEWKIVMTTLTSTLKQSLESMQQWPKDDRHFKHVNVSWVIEQVYKLSVAPAMLSFSLISDVGVGGETHRIMIRKNIRSKFYSSIYKSSHWLFWIFPLSLHFRGSFPQDLHAISTCFNSG